MNIDYRSIALYLNRKGYSARDILFEINVTFGPNTIAYSTITKYLREAKYFQSKMPTANSSEILVHEKEQILIKNALKNFPFLSVREIAKMTFIPKSTVYRILKEELHYENRHLKWIPHSLKPSQLSQRVEFSGKLLEILREYKEDNYNLFYTGDESWFYLNTDYDQQWVPAGETPANRVKQTINSKKYMLTVFWNPKGFLLVEALDDNMVFNADYFINQILEQISCKTERDVEISKKKLVLHYDNARPHISKKVSQYLTEKQIIRAPQPPYSPDIAPSDFYLFGYVKNKLKGSIFNSKEELLDNVIEILEDIPIETLEKVFTDWEKRLEQVISTNGAYI